MENYGILVRISYCFFGLGDDVTLMLINRECYSIRKRRTMLNECFWLKSVGGMSKRLIHYLRPDLRGPASQGRPMNKLRRAG